MLTRSVALNINTKRYSFPAQSFLTNVSFYDDTMFEIIFQELGYNREAYFKIAII